MRPCKLRVGFPSVAILGLCTFFAVVILLTAQQPAHAATGATAYKRGANAQFSLQDVSLLKGKIQEFLQTQTVGYPGKVELNVGVIDPNLRLAACADAQVFFPAGSRAWGNTSVGVRCLSPSWTIYVQSTVHVHAQYLVAASPLAQGHVVASEDLIFETGDLTRLPAGIFTNINHAVGRTVGVSVTAGTVLRQEMLKMPLVVQQGQTVMLVSTGRGFQVFAEGKAMTKATEGQVVQVKVASGQVVSGIARQGGTVEVGF